MRPEVSDEDEDIDCLTCMDTGEYVAGESGLLMPCPNCERGIWNNWTELADEMRMEKDAS